MEYFLKIPRVIKYLPDIGIHAEVWNIPDGVNIDFISLEKDKDGNEVSKIKSKQLLNTDMFMQK